MLKLLKEEQCLLLDTFHLAAQFIRRMADPHLTRMSVALIVNMANKVLHSESCFTPEISDLPHEEMCRHEIQILHCLSWSLHRPTRYDVVLEYLFHEAPQMLAPGPSSEILTLLCESELMEDSDERAIYSIKQAIASRVSRRPGLCPRIGSKRSLRER